MPKCDTYRFNNVLLLFVFFVLIGEILCCSSGRRRGCKGKRCNNPTTNPNNNNNPGNTVNSFLGDNVRVDPYDNGGFDSKGGIANGPSDLNCDFDSPCCWKNVVPPADTMQWLKASGQPDAAKLTNNFGTSTAPQGSYLAVASDRATSSTDSARFKSCTVCSTSPVGVRMSHWQTRDVQLQVCTQDGGNDNNALLNCQNLDPNNRDVVTLPAGQNFNIVIVATNFVNNQGGMAMIDDILTDYTPCGVQTDPTPQPNSTPGGGGTVCQAVVCNFEAGNPCSYVDATNTGSGGSQAFKTVKGRFGNPLTGIRQASDGNYYGATYLMPQESAGLQTNTDFDQDRVIRFDSYRATDEVFLKGCCDRIDTCPYDSHKSVQLSDFNRWKSISFTCPKGTKQVLFYAKNEGPNQGAVGLDNINLLIPSGGSPDQALQTAC